jgi:hypothetical protein
MALAPLNGTALQPAMTFVDVPRVPVAELQRVPQGTIADVAETMGLVDPSK